MIPEIYVEQWRESAGWQTLAQIEQDLIISRALVDLYQNEFINNSLVFRGGTALNKLFLQPAARYSEDLDFVQKSAEPIGDTINAIRVILEPWLGEPKRKLTQRSAKLIFRYEAINKLPSKLKIEINTTEHFQVMPLKIENFEVSSSWFSGLAKIQTYEIDELIATKIRALYQRRKGRDLFDLWYVIKQDLVNIDNVIDIFVKYCEHDGISISRGDFINNLQLKKANQDFKLDMNFLLPQQVDWHFESAYELVMQSIIERLPE